MSARANVTVSLSLTIASVVAWLGNALAHYVIYGNDVDGFNAFRFFARPAIVLLLAVVPTAAVLIVRLAQGGRAVTLHRGQAYAWLFGALILLNVAATIATVSVEDVETWPLFFMILTPLALLASSVLGVLALMAASAIITRRARELTFPSIRAPGQPPSVSPR